MANQNLTLQLAFILSTNKNFAVGVLKYEYILIKTGSDEILRKNVDGAHLHHNEVLHAKFGKYRTVRFRSSVRTDIHTYIHTDGRDTPSMP